MAEFCWRHRVHRLALGGTVLRVDFRSDSAFVVPADFKPDPRAGLFEMARTELEFTALLERKVDLGTPAELSRYFRSGWKK